MFTDVLIAVSPAIELLSFRVARELELIWVCLFVYHKNNILGVCSHPSSNNATFARDLDDGLNTT